MFLIFTHLAYIFWYIIYLHPKYFYQNYKFLCKSICFSFLLWLFNTQNFRFNFLYLRIVYKICLHLKFPYSKYFPQTFIDLYIYVFDICIFYIFILPKFVCFFFTVFRNKFHIYANFRFWYIFEMLAQIFRKFFFLFSIAYHFSVPSRCRYAFNFIFLKDFSSC